MSEINQSDVRMVLDSRLRTWNLGRSSALEIAWQNVPLTPRSETYLRAFLLPAGMFSRDLEGKLRTYLGVYQVTIVTPVGNGPGAADGIAYEIAQQFSVNLILGTTLKVQIMTPVSMAPAFQDGSSFTLPVSFEVRADLI